MTEQQEPRPETEREGVPPPEPVSPETAGRDEVAQERRALGDTVGTGTTIALGCVIGTVVVVLIGLLYLVILLLTG